MCQEIIILVQALGRNKLAVITLWRALKFTALPTAHVHAWVTPPDS